MPVKRCCVSDCLSCSTRNEDKGVTYHKFPKSATKLRDEWANVAHLSILKLVQSSFVCSRHFCRGDFIKNKESKYILKSDAVPSIFPWVVDSLKMEPAEWTENKTEHDDSAKPNVDENDPNVSGSSKSSEIENLDNIKKFIEAQEQHIQNKKSDKIQQNIESTDQSSALKTYQNVDNSDQNIKSDEVIQKASIQMLVGDLEMKFKNLEKKENVDLKIAYVENDKETMAVASSVMEMILSETEAKTLKPEALKALPKPTINPSNSSMPLSVGSRVEAKDFSEEWYPAEIAEVDFDEMEVLVHYDNYLKKSDEWISVSSPRLRPFTGTSKPEQPELLKLLTQVKEEPKEIKTEDKNKVYVVGERCLARWRDNRRFVATIDKDLGDGKFEVIFDDGFRWPCALSRLSKLKEQRDALSIDTSLPSTSGAPSPVLQGGPSSNTSVPIYHTHLFDPTRDYLGSKSERREKKRKLNIKEIFNIGQKKQKVKVEKKMPKEKVKKIVKAKAKEVIMEKTGIPADAVASILGTADVKHEIKEEISESMEVDDYSLDQPDDTTDSKSDLDPVEEEDKLEKFDKPDQTMHDEVMDKMKEVISKLEGGLKEDIEKLKSPKVVMIDPPKSSIEPLKLVTEASKSDIDTITDEQNATIDSELAIDTLKLEITPILSNVTPKFNEPLKIDVEITTTDNKASDVLSPSLIETSESDFNKILPDDDTTKSDIEMGNESPRLDIDSQPIVVDIDAPLDMDLVEEQTIVKKHKKIKNKDSERPKKKMKKEQKKKLFSQKWAEVDQVKTELFEMQQKMKQMMREIEREKKFQISDGVPLPESCLVPGEWACRWVNGQPIGKVSEMEADIKPDASGKPALPRRSVEVVDKRLPEGWTKHMVRRSVGHSAGKWDVVLVSPANRRFHTKVDMRHYLETASEDIKAYEHALMDFGVHLKLSRKLGWITSTPDGATIAPETILPSDSKSCLSPLVKRKTLSLKRRPGQKEKKKRPIKIKLQRRMHTYNAQLIDAEGEASSLLAAATQSTAEPMLPALEEGYVWVGSLKVQVIENLLRCPAEGCFKNFRNNTLLQMHIKHYHRELRKMMGATPKVLDLAAARSKPTLAKLNRTDKTIKVKTNKPPKLEPQEQEVDVTHSTPIKEETLPKIPRSQDSPKLRNALININKPVKRPRVLLPVKRPDQEQYLPDSFSDDDFETDSSPRRPVLDFEAAISTHTVTKPLDKKKKGDKKKSFASFSKQISEDEEFFAMNSDELDTRSSFPRSGTPDDAKIIDPKTGMLLSSDPIYDQLDPSLYTVTETGERIKIVHMKREEIINCHCGFREEDGLMVQCELCLCWQHALCHNIQKESEVPEKYTCSICLNPRRGRRSKRFAHDQERLYEGLLPGGGARGDDSLRRSHELAGNLLRVHDALHALRVKHYVATKKDHPKLYLWAKDWEQAEIPYKLNSEYSDLSIMINGMDKENLPMKPDEPMPDMRMVSEDEPDSDRLSQREGQAGSQALLSGLLSSPTASLDLPISTSELERLAKTVQEAAAEWGGSVVVPEPEAPIENEACRARLLKHIQCCQALLDSRLDSIEAQVAELESQDPSFGEHYETAEHYPHIKQTVQMLMRDLDTMEELGVIT